MDFGKAFTFMFEDPEWLRKLGIGVLVALVGILFSPILIGLVPLIMLLGYSLDTLRNVADGHERPMPEWEDWGGFLSRGFKLVAALFVWALPMLLALIPLIIGSAMTEQYQQNNLGVVAVILLICGSCLVLLWGLFLTLLSPALYARIALTDRFSSAFEFGKLWAFTRDNIGNIVIAILLTWVAGLVASIIAPLGLIALFIGVLITFPFASLWQYLVQAHLFGQIAKQSVTAVG